MESADDGQCRAIQASVLAYIAQTLAPAARAEYEGHLARCPTCRDYVDKMLDAAELSCAELVELVTDYLEDRLAPAERERFEAHLTLCAGCRDYLAQIRETIRLTGRLSEDAIAPEAKRELLDAFRHWKRG
jgi:anti-sigma factor RsiW